MSSKFIHDEKIKWGHSTNGSEWDEWIEGIAEKQHDQIENMSMLIRRLVFVARRAGTKSKVPEQALDYLERQGLINAVGFLRQDGD